MIFTFSEIFASPERINEDSDHEVNHFYISIRCKSVALTKDSIENIEKKLLPIAARTS